MRTIEVTVMKTVVFITDWNHATRRLFKETDGMFRCTLPDRTTQIRVATFYEFLTTLFGQRQIGAFLNYEVKIKGNDELQEGQTGTLKKSYLGYRHVEFVEYDYPRVRVQLSSGLEISVWEDEVIWDEYYE